VALAKLYGAKKILAVDLNKKRLQLAKKIGATDIFKSANTNQETIIKKISNKTKTSSYDIVVVSANGNVKSHELACSLVAKKRCGEFVWRNS
jgi:L-iditol 2-dehydrogenase